MTQFEPITDPVPVKGKKKITIFKNCKSKGGGSNKKEINITRKCRNPYRSKGGPYKNPYEGNNAWAEYLKSLKN